VRASSQPVHLYLWQINQWWRDLDKVRPSANSIKRGLLQATRRQAGRYFLVVTNRGICLRGVGVDAAFHVVYVRKAGLGY
jgi:hypothetical protein